MMATPLQLTGLKPQPGFHCSHRPDLSMFTCTFTIMLGYTFSCFVCVSVQITLMYSLDLMLYMELTDKKEKKNTTDEGFFSCIL